MKKKQHGGIRKGAGRKPAPLKMVSFRISIDPNVHTWFIDRAVSLGKSISSLYAEAAEEFKTAHIESDTDQKRKERHEHTR